LVCRSFEFFLNRGKYKFSNSFSGDVSTTSLTNKLARKNKFVKNKAKESRESELRTGSSEQRSTTDSKQINTHTTEKDPSVREYSLSAHQESLLTRGTSYFPSGHSKEEFLFNPIQEKKFHTTDSEGSIAHQGPTPFWFDMDHLEGTGTINGDYHEKGGELATFEFPIKDSLGTSQMKNIPPSTLPNFCGTSSEDPTAFLFEFDVLCRSYDYSSNAQKLNLFHSTLKDASLRWFMGLSANSISTWVDMKKVLLKKYQDYYKTKDIREEIFGMTHKEEEILEEFLEIFQYNCKDPT